MTGSGDTRKIVAESRRLADGLPSGVAKRRILALCDVVEAQQAALTDVVQASDWVSLSKAFDAARVFVRVDSPEATE